MGRPAAGYKSNFSVSRNSCIHRRLFVKYDLKPNHPALEGEKSAHERALIAVIPDKSGIQLVDLNSKADNMIAVSIRISAIFYN